MVWVAIPEAAEVIEHGGDPTLLGTAVARPTQPAPDHL
jgi:hypothetical protein